MKIIAFILVSLMVVSTAMAAEMGSLKPMPMKISGGHVGFAPRVPGGCHFEMGKGVVCMGIGPHMTFQPARNTTSDECYFDKVKGAICPGRPMSQGVFVSQRYRDPFVNMGKVPARISTPPPTTISGDFKGPMMRRHMETKARIGPNWSN